MDLGVLRPPVEGADLTLRTITTESLLLALPADHRLAAQPGVVMEDLRSEDWVMYTDEHSAMNEGGAAQLPGQPGSRHIVGTPRPPPVCCWRWWPPDSGVALVPESVRNSPLTGVVFLDLPDAHSIELALAGGATSNHPSSPEFWRHWNRAASSDTRDPTQEAAS